MPQRFSDLANIALVEYTGPFPTASAVMDRIQESIDNEQSNIDIYETMVLKDPENAPRDHQLIRSKRYHHDKY